MVKHTLAKRKTKIAPVIETAPLKRHDKFYFKREPDSRQVLYVTLWYVDGSTDQLIITSPHMVWGEDIERQYLYIRMYLNKSFEDLGIIAYQGSISHLIGDQLQKPVGAFAKIDCSTLKPWKPDQFCEHENNRGSKVEAT
ncbi:hypothetical protein [Spirosoma harenae]